VLRPACCDCSEHWSAKGRRWRIWGISAKRFSDLKRCQASRNTAKPPQSKRLGQLDLLKHHASLTAQSRGNHIAASGGKAEMLHTVRERLAPPITGWTRILRCN